MHEASLHEQNCFLTLTYSPENLPADGSLNKRHFQLFCKRMRKACGRFRFFHCGEYGEQFARPHYHACIFGFDFPDKVLFRDNAGNKLYTSELLDSLWQLGHCMIGAVTFESAAYVARYVTKKVTGDRAADHYQSVNFSTGEISFLSSEYSTMSRRPGIGADWFRKFSNEVFPSDEIIARGFAARPPRFYDGLQESLDPVVIEAVRKERRLAIDRLNGEFTAERLAVKERVAKAKLSLAKRPIG